MLYFPLYNLWNNLHTYLDRAHKILKRCGGTDHINNLCLLHTNCHRQVHSKRGQLIAAVSKLLEPYA
ncbi:HNH endonuclease family protein [Rickettsia hoogstraalii str. RCCE3]|nr:HNH endonuclease family protein [Rickettsia hoogstraalii str. RCCE3]